MHMKVMARTRKSGETHALMHRQRTAIMSSSPQGGLTKINKNSCQLFAIDIKRYIKHKPVWHSWQGH